MSATSKILYSGGNIQFNDLDNSHNVKWKANDTTTDSYTLTMPATAPPGVRFLTLDATGQLAYSVAASGTLDNAYDSGGAGAGRTITADTGAVQIVSAAQACLDLDQNGNFPCLDIDKTAAGAGTVVDINNAGTGNALSVTQNGATHGTVLTQNAAGRALRVLQNATGVAIEVVHTAGDTGVSINNSGAGTNLVCGGTGSGIGVQIDKSGTGGTPAILINNSRTDANADSIRISETGAHAGSSIEVNRTNTSATGHVIVLNNAGASRAISITQTSTSSAARAVNIVSENIGLYVQKSSAAGTVSSLAIFDDDYGLNTAATVDIQKGSGDGYGLRIQSGGNEYAMFVENTDGSGNATGAAVFEKNSGNGPACVQVIDPGSQGCLFIDQNGTGNSYGIRIDSESVGPLIDLLPASTNTRADIQFGIARTTDPSARQEGSLWYNASDEVLRYSDNDTGDDIYDIGTYTNRLRADPGDTNTIVPYAVTNTICLLTSGTGGETRVMGAPAHIGQRVIIQMETDGGGNILITNTDGWLGGGSADDVATFANAGDSMIIEAHGTADAQDWRVTSYVGVTFA